MINKSLTSEEKIKKIWDENMPLPVPTSEDIEETFRRFGREIKPLVNVGEVK